MGRIATPMVHSTHYIEVGASSAPSVLLLHDGAWGADAVGSWAKVAEGLSDDYHVIAPDLLGYGLSEKVVQFDVDPYATRTAQLSSICSRLCESPPHVVGVSFGGSLALYAAAMRAFPMASCTSISGTVGLWRTPDAVRVLSAEYPTAEYLLKLGEMLAPGLDRAELESLASRRRQNLTRPGAYAAIASRGLRYVDELPKRRLAEFPEALRRSEVPISLIRGTRDELLVKNWAERFGESVPGISTISMDTGHCPNLSHPSELLAILRKVFVSA